MTKSSLSAFSPQRVFLTGATGFIGRAILEALIQEGIPASVLSRMPFSGRERYPSVLFFEGDIADEAILKQALTGCDTIIHCAGQISFDDRFCDALHFIHVEATRLLAETGKTLGVKRMVYVSSHWTIGFTTLRNYLCTEGDYLHPDGKIHNIYQQTKHEGERLLASVTSSYPEFVIVNPSQVWGPGNRNPIFQHLIQKAEKNRFFWVPAGGVNIVHLNDVARGVLLALLYGRPGERYLLGGQNVTFRELALLFIEARNKKGLVFEIPSRPLRWMSSLLFPLLAKLMPESSKSFNFLKPLLTYKFYSSHKAAQELGFRPVYTLPDIIKEALQEKREFNLQCHMKT